jgi:DNA-binding LacI/PurR family transcriptional regulator
VPSSIERPVTLSAVARRARVSIATVSYVLNGVRQSRIPERTQTRVRDAARDLGYVPNISARSLRIGRSDLVIAHLPDTSMLQRTAAGLDRLGGSLRAAGYTLLVHGDPSLGGLDAARLWSALRPCALITEAGLLDEASLALLQGVGCVVIATANKLDPKLPTLLFDDSQLGELATQALIARGCRDIVMLVPMRARARARARFRLAGARRAARAVKGARVRTVAMNDTPLDAQRVAALFSGDGQAEPAREKPEGVFGFDDLHSALLLSALCDRGVRVPAELALIGADDDPICEIVRPRMSSVAIDLDLLHHSIAEPVIAAIRGQWKPSMSNRPWSAALRLRET